jgi:flagellar basal body-associated protein FliL
MIENKQKKRTNIKLYTYIIFLALAAMMLMFYLFKTYTISDYVLLVVFSVLSAIAETFLILLPKIGGVSVCNTVD